MSMPSRISHVVKHPEGLSILLDPQDERQNQRRPIDEQRLLVIVSPYKTTPQVGDFVLVTRNAVIISSARDHWIKTRIYARQGYTRIIEPTMTYRVYAHFPASHASIVPIGYADTLSGSSEGMN